jgi:hypothetical protein
MTKEEFQQLRVGDKITYTEKVYLETELRLLQEENGGFLVIARLRKVGNKTAGIYFESKSRSGSYGLYRVMDFCRPWSYERDY